MDHFLAFHPLATQSIKIFLKMKKNPWRYHHFAQVYHKWQSYDIWLLRCEVQQAGFFCHLGSWQMQLLFFILGYFLPFYPPNIPRNENFKKWKKILEISSFNTSVPKIMIICYNVPEIWPVTHVIVIFYFGQFFGWVDSWTDGWKNWDIVVGASPKNQ